MNRRNFYYRQLVAEADMDEVFDLAEDADRALMVDQGVIGILDGLDISEAGAPDLTVECDAGVAYDQDGQRMYVPSVQTVNLAVDSDGNSTDVNTPGNIKWLSVFLRFKQDLSNPKTDGNNVTVQYDVDESFEFIVEQSAEDVAPSRPALKSDAILLADIQRNEGDTTIENAEISTTRRQWAFNVSAGSYSVKVGQVEEAVQALLTALNSHVTNGSGAHAASAVSNTPAGNIAATTVQAALNELDTEKGGLAVVNTWTQAQTFSAGATVDSLVVNTLLYALNSNVTFYADASNITFTRKLLSSTATNEDTQETEVYATGQPTTINVGTLTTGYISRFEVDVHAVRQGSSTNAHAVKLIATFEGTGPTQIGSTSNIGDHGTEAGAISLSNSGSTVQVTLTPTNDLNVRCVVRRSRLKVAA